MKDANQAAEQAAYVKKRLPEVTEIVGDIKSRATGGVHSIGVNLRKSKKHPDVSAKCTGVKFPDAL